MELALLVFAVEARTTHVATGVDNASSTQWCTTEMDPPLI